MNNDKVVTNLHSISFYIYITTLTYLTVVQQNLAKENRSQCGLNCGFRQPSESHEDFLFDVELSSHHCGIRGEHSDDESQDQNQERVAQGSEVDLVYLDLCSNEGKDDRLEDDPHPLECFRDWVVVPPALWSPLHPGNEGHDDGGQAPGPVVVDQMSSEQSNEPPAKQDQPPVM